MTIQKTRIENLRRQIAGRRLAEFATDHDLDASYLSQILNGHRGFGERAARKMELKIGLPAGALDSPAGDPNTRPGPDRIGKVPLISSVQAGTWCDIADSFQPGDADEWLPCPVRHGPNTFCLVVEGESMRNPLGRPSYDPGDIIFVDPDVTARPGDRVVVRLESQAQATFKQYLEEDGQKVLKALNPDWLPRYIPINGDATICGVVIGKWVPE